MTTTPHVGERARLMLNKVPEVTVYFWIIKILCTTVGESFADYINETLGLRADQHDAGVLGRRSSSRWSPSSGWTATSRRVYWLAVVLISVVGTLLTDNLTDARGVPLWISTTVFAVLLAGVFGDLVRPRAHAVDPHHRHHPARGLLLAGGAGDLRAGHGGGRLDPRADRLVAGRRRSCCRSG